MKRRAFNLSLPASDPHSATIMAWLDAQQPGIDVAPELRRMLATAIALTRRLDAIERKIDQVLTVGAIATSPASLPAQPLGAAETAALDRLFDFD
jgi:hypothetical protein